MVAVLATPGRNYLTGAALTAPTSGVHVLSSAGERTEALQAPTSFMPSTYVRMDSVTWTSWNENRAAGFARISSQYPGEIFGGGSSWIHMRLDCPTRHGGQTYFGRYTLSWITGPPLTGVDGWESPEPRTLFPGSCKE